MAKLTERSETQRATDSIRLKFNALDVIADNERSKPSIIKEEKRIETVVAQKTDSKQISEDKNKVVSDTTVGIRMTEAKKREMKAFFIQNGTTMSQGVLDAFGLLKSLLEEGRISYEDGVLVRA